MHSSYNNQQAGYEYAGFWVRLAAYMIDSVIVFCALLVVRLFFAGVSVIIEGTILDSGILFQYTLKDIVLYLFKAMYFVLCTYLAGTTPGKKALNLRVIRAGGEEKPELLDVIYRETIGRFLCSFSVWIGYLLIGFSAEKSGLHDMLGDTRVIYAKKVKVYPVYQYANFQPAPIMAAPAPAKGEAVCDMPQNPQEENVYHMPQNLQGENEEENIEGIHS